MIYKLDESDLTLLLLFIAAVLLASTFNLIGPFGLADPANIEFDESTNTLYLDSLTIEQKVAQMVITYGADENKEVLQNMFIGGFHKWGDLTKEEYMDSIAYLQDGAVVPFFVTVDLEGGCVNPFEAFLTLPAFRDIETKEDAYKIGNAKGRLLREMGVNMNFAPVVDLNDTIWNCRSFRGTPEEIGSKAVYYIRGLQEQGVHATAKHYPGKALSIKDPHKFVTHAYIEKDDLLPFEQSIQNGVSAVMASHIIVVGEVSSDSKPSVSSEILIDGLREQYTGLIVTDEIGMLGIDDYYLRASDMYIDLFKADNDLILNFDQDPRRLYYMVRVVANAVRTGKISEDRIDDSVVRILDAKGINVVR